MTLSEAAIAVMLSVIGVLATLHSLFEATSILLDKRLVGIVRRSRALARMLRATIFSGALVLAFWTMSAGGLTTSRSFAYAIAFFVLTASIPVGSYAWFSMSLSRQRRKANARPRD
ncbi:hypothetical protein [Paraburkholderia sp.]|jgi:hypothetical protein|uniref:hypothetical protein n=1 Tax=Paraburkholderia sp. TaxID=1926495 RepID=UPI003C7B816A